MANDTIITVVGNLTADPELRFTQNGNQVVSITIASTPRTFDRATGTFVDGDALFMRCSAWRDFAQHIADSLTKGTRVIAQGRLVQRSYKAADGTDRTSIELQLDAIGPDLTWATASVTRAQSTNSNGGGNFGGNAAAARPAANSAPAAAPAKADEIFADEKVTDPWANEAGNQDAGASEDVPF